MSMSSIERAARAFALVASGNDEWDNLDANTQNRLKQAVRSSLMTLYTPSTSVLRAGARKLRRTYRSNVLRAEATWQAMIDAAVEER
jgi:hypothetical protein